jgi:competence protein ComEA
MTDHEAGESGGGVAPEREHPRFVITPRALVVVALLLVAVLTCVLVLGSPRSDKAASVRIDGADAAAASASGSPLPSSTPSPSQSAVIVHVAGAVVSPGLRTMRPGDRVDAAITAAGGASDDADLARVNLARPVVDGEQLYIPKVGEADPPVAPGGAGGGTAAGGSGARTTGGTAATVDLNSADSAALETLPGIGPALAARILAWRDEHGRFSSPEDLLDVSGIGESKFADLRERVRV